MSWHTATHRLPCTTGQRRKGSQAQAHCSSSREYCTSESVRDGCSQDTKHLHSQLHAAHHKAVVVWACTGTTSETAGNCNKSTNMKASDQAIKAGNKSNNPFGRAHKHNKSAACPAIYTVPALLVYQAHQPARPTRRTHVPLVGTIGHKDNHQPHSGVWAPSDAD